VLDGDGVFAGRCQVDWFTIGGSAGRGGVVSLVGVPGRTRIG
jgi:hypothetical protein